MHSYRVVGHEKFALAGLYSKVLFMYNLYTYSNHILYLRRAEFFLMKQKIFVLRFKTALNRILPNYLPGNLVVIRILLENLRTFHFSFLEAYIKCNVVIYTYTLFSVSG